ncbi:MAG: amidase family protein [Polyangiaceae bacterium]
MTVHEMTASQLLDALAAGELTSVEAVEALGKRRRDVDPMVNAFVHLREAALDEAREADAERARGELRGPLHGLPITIKDNIAVAGTDATLGMQARRGHPDREDAVLVAELRRLGAIVIGKTNVPQLLLAQETENRLFGVTQNPFHLGHVPGGSSGGEAAAVASGMSPLGIGTDIGGSIRIPAHFCGVFGLKPGLDRWSNRGSHTGIPGQEVVRAQIGCFARSAADVALLWRSVDPRRLAEADPRVPPLPPTDPAEVELAGLRIGWWDDDPFLSPAPSLKRAIHRAKEVFEAAGATLVPHEPVPSEDILFTWLAAISADGGRTMDRALAGEAPSPQLRPSRALARLPAAARQTLSRVLSGLGEWRVSRLLQCLGDKPVDELWALSQRRTDLRLAEIDAWREAELDLLLCPPHVVPALPHRESSDFILSLGAEFRWTLLDFPAGVAPVTTARASEVGKLPKGGDRVEKKLRRMDDKSTGLPVGVQLVSRPYDEHKIVAAMACLEAAVAGDEGFPKTPVSPRG